MKKLINQFVDITKDIKGNVLCFGIDNKKILNIIESNKNIDVCDILTNRTIFSNKEENKLDKKKQVKVNRLRNRYKRNKVNYIYINVDDIIGYRETIVKDTIYICNNKIYLYSENKLDIDNFLRRYKRYKIKLNKIECLDNVMYELDVSKIKSRKFKDKINGFIDNIIDLIDMAGDIV